MGGKRYRNRQIIPPKPNGPQPGSITRVQASYFSGPLPPPEVLARYNDVVPNGADRILSMAERQSAHRESLETKVVDGNLATQRSGSNRAFILALIVILGGFYLMATGKNGWGFAAIISSLASLATVFFMGRSAQKKERVEKEAALDQRQRR